MLEIADINPWRDETKTSLCFQTVSMKTCLALAYYYKDYCYLIVFIVISPFDTNNVQNREKRDRGVVSVLQ